MSLSLVFMSPPLRNNGVAALPLTNKVPPVAKISSKQCKNNRITCFAHGKDLKAIPVQDRVKIMSEALPFIQKFRGKTIVVKYGGAAMKSEALLKSLIADVVLLSCVGLRIVLVHEGGPDINQWLTRLDIKPNFLNGLRVTDALTMEMVSMVLVGKVTNLVQLINNTGAKAVGLSGIDGGLFTAWPTPDASESGFVGEIESLDPTLLHLLLDGGHIPVIAPLANDVKRQLYNINADTVAGKLAEALVAEKLVLFSDAGGILEDVDVAGSLVKEIDAEGAKNMIKIGKISGGMRRKVECCLGCLAQGVMSASMIDAGLEHCLLREIVTVEGAGTMITG